jgi:hypothetical protein
LLSKKSVQENIIISSNQAKDENLQDLAFHTNNDQLICLAFLDKFNDSIIIYLNKKKMLTFIRKDTLSYKNLEHSEIFKIIKKNKKKNAITVFLENQKKSISFNLLNDKKLYLISHYGNTWFLNIRD